MNKLPEFKPLPEVENLRSNYMSAFNHGMNIYEALVYLQGYVQITYKSMDDLLNDWNNFEKYIDENISQISNEKTQEILNQWKSDGTLNEIIMKNPLWNQKVNKAGDVMSGDLQFQENTGVYGTLHSGTKVNMISHSYTGTDDYTQIGDDNAQAVIHSEKRPVWYDGSKNQDLLVEEDLNTTKLNISEIQDKIKTGAYFTSNVDGQLTITNYQGNNNVSIIQPSDVVNNLNSSETNKPLSANQGKILKDLIDSKFPDLVVGQEIPLPFNLWTGHQAYLKMVHTGQLTASTSPTIAHGIQNAEVCIIVPWLSFAYSDGGRVWVNIPRPTRGGIESNQGIMANASLQNINITVGSDANFGDSHITVLFSKKNGVGEKI